MSLFFTFISAVQARRSYYNISAKSPIEASAIKDIIDQAVLHVPSAYNVQGGRAILLEDEANRQLWSVIKEHTIAWLSKSADEAMIKVHSGKLDSFAAGYGTVAFFEDQTTIDASYQRAPQFKGLKLFDAWAEQSNAMLQYVVWTALEAEGFGASLQHHPVMVEPIKPALSKLFDIPFAWKAIALIPFGVPHGGPGQAGMPAKTFKPIDERVKVIHSAL